MQTYKVPIQQSQLGQVFSILSRRDRVLFLVVLAIQIVLGLLDLLGVAVIGLLGALSLNGVQSRPPGDRVSRFLQLVHLYGETFQFQAAALGVIATLVFIFRTIASIFLTRRVLYFLSRRGALLSAELARKLMKQSLVSIQEKTMYENLFALTSGVSSITLGILGSVVILVADTSLLTIMALGLLYVDPLMAISTIIFFAFIGYSLYWFMHKKAIKLGSVETELNIKSNEKIIEALSSYRESVVRNRRDFYAKEIGKLRFELAGTLAEISFMPNVSKYLIESALVLGGLLICATQFILQDAAHAVATLAIFLAAGTRVAPAVLRVQQGAIQIKQSTAAAKPTLDLIAKIGRTSVSEVASDVIDFTHKGFTPSVSLQKVEFTYPGAAKPTIRSVSVEIESGSKVAIVGPSGAGKSTLIDLLLGILQPDNGMVSISNSSASRVSEIWPGAISYVPQEVVISNGTILSNITLGFPAETVDMKSVRDAVKSAQLETLINEFPEGINTKVGDRGSTLSGGQKQRLGIARALYTRPKLLVLDEATSALDGETEFNISNALSNLTGDVTVILIAHRLSTIREVDKIIYLEDGKVVCEGTFDEVRSKVANFDNQATLMGL